MLDPRKQNAEWLEADGLGGFAGGTRENATLRIRPFLSGRDFHATHHENGAFRFDAEQDGERVEWRPYAGVPGVIARGNGCYAHGPLWFRNFLYTEELARGLDA